MDNFLLFQVTQHHLLQQIEGNEWTHIDFIHSQQLVINEISWNEVENEYNNLVVKTYFE